MIPSSPRQHRASYDDDGNIILPSVEDVADAAQSAFSASDEGPDDLVEEWIEEEFIVEKTIERPAEKVAGGLKRLAKETFAEGRQQYRVSIGAIEPGFRGAQASMRSLPGTLWAFLSQPVWVPGRRKTIKQYSRGRLFAQDIVRFGLTFAGIFFLLFAALNYQSFWQIMRARMDGFLSGPSLQEGTDNGVSDIFRNLEQGAREQGNLLSVLPPVGPPENILIIPKLALTVPLVTPPSDALLKQDWTKVEADIQKALQDGVVHYPGTASPGRAGNFFVTGHSSYYPWAPGQYKSIFARLGELDIGDEYIVYYGGDKHRYVVHEKKEIKPSDTTVLDQPTNERISTLMTCTPVGTTLRRLIIRAKEVDLVTGKELAVGERTEPEPLQRVPLEALPI